MNILMLLVAMLTVTMGTTATVDDVKKQIGETHTQVADYLVDNVPLFVSQCTRATGEAFAATSVEFRQEIFVTSTESYAEYLDFDGDNGYALLADDYWLLDFSTTGQLDWFSYDKEVTYSEIDGYTFHIADGSYISFELWQMAVEAGMDIGLSEEDTPKKIILEETEEKSLLFIDGEKSAEVLPEVEEETRVGTPGVSFDNKIYDPDLYMDGKYGDGFEMTERTGDSPDIRYKGQYEVSVYELTPIGSLVPTSEGNCLLSAIYYALYYMMQRGFYPNFPDFNGSSNAKNEPFYDDLMNNPEKYGCSSIRLLHEYIPKLYFHIRSWFKSNDGYRVGGADYTKSVKCIKWLCEFLHQKGLNPRLTDFISYDYFLKEELNNRRYMVWCLVGDEVYGSHAVVMTGSRTYERVTYYGMLRGRETKMLVMINNNHNDVPIYMDYELYLRTSLYRSSVLRF